MNIILSRKGFDSSCGGVPSPILPDGTLLSLPVPADRSPISYEELSIDGEPAGPLVENLTRGRIRRTDGAHLDPDLRASACRRLPGWQPLFGQVGAAQTRLARAGVTAGDLFLFFGWFRQVERTDGRYRFVRGAPDLHVLFGWLQIGAILPVNGQETHAPPWAAYHPHLHYGPVRGNTLYMARETLELGGLRTSVPGGGAFARYDERLCLTAPGHTRATWRLPAWFHPGDGRTPLSYHADPKRWQAGDGCALLRSVCQGQEFVLDADQYPETLAWARTLIAGSSHEFHE